MKHYVIVLDWANENESGTTIFGVTHSMEDAKKVFNEHLPQEKEYAVEDDYTIFEDCETVFDAGEDGSYLTNHRCMSIHTV